MTDLERVAEYVNHRGRGDLGDIIDAHLKEDAEREGRRIFAEGRRNAMEAELAVLREKFDQMQQERDSFGHQLARATGELAELKGHIRGSRTAADLRLLQEYVEETP